MSLAKEMDEWMTSWESASSRPLPGPSEFPVLHPAPFRVEHISATKQRSTKTCESIIVTNASSYVTDC